VELATVTSSQEAAPSEGRRVPLYSLTPKAGVAVGVEIGRRHITVELVDAGHRQVRAPLNKAIEASADEHPADVLRQCAALVRRALGEADIHGRVLGIAVGLPQPVTSEGLIGTTTLMPAWAEVDPAAVLAPELDFAPVYIGNEADFGALGEYVFGVGEAKRDLVYVKLGTGIGAGTILNGKLHQGASGIASEFGHITIDFRGRRCPCGNRGCLERYAGGKALLDEAQDAGLDIDSLPALVQRARSDDIACQRIITEAAAMIGTALGALINLSGPDLIVLGGSLSAAGELLTRPLRTAMEQAAFPPAAQAVSIEAARLDRLASARGAAAFVFESLATWHNLRAAAAIRRFGFTSATAIDCRSDAYEQSARRVLAWY
jgi:predicted NBD/HSP70 family sugar kinase